MSLEKRRDLKGTLDKRIIDSGWLRADFNQVGGFIGCGVFNLG